MLLHELEESIELIRDNKSLTPHRAEQVNRVLRWFAANWDEVAGEASEWAHHNQEPRYMWTRKRN